MHTDTRKLINNSGTLLKGLIILFLFSFPIIFNEFTEQLLYKTLVRNLLETFHPTLFSDIVYSLIIIGIIIIWLFYNRKIDKKLDNTGLIIILLISIYYSIYRFELFGYDFWTFKSLNSISAFKYFDFVFLIVLLLTLYKIFTTISNKKSLNPRDTAFSLLSDDPIETIDQDKLNRSALADYVSKTIVQTFSEKSIAIGLNAKWGDGKTSFKNLIRIKLLEKDKRAIILDYNPWMSSNRKSISSHFLEQFAITLGSFDFSISNMIKKYSEQLASSKQNWWTVLISSLFSPFYDKKDIYGQRGEINRLIKKIDRKIVVFVDDLDRLFASEIVEVLKLVRNTANFSNTFFIIGFDRSYVIEALKKYPDKSSQNFLDKILQMEFNLDEINDQQISKELSSLLIRKLPKYEVQINAIFSVIIENSPRHDTVEMYGIPMFNEPNKIKPGISTYIRNFRDIKRFTNNFVLSINNLGSDLVFEEYFRVSLLRFRYPSILEIICINKDKIFTKKDTVSIGLNKEILTYNRQKYDELIEDFDLTERENVSKILEDLFIINPEIGKSNYSSIIYDFNFDKYFYNRSSDRGLLYKEMLDTFDKDWTDASKMIQQWINEDKLPHLIKVLEGINHLASKRRFSNIVRTWTILINQPGSGLSEFYGFIRLFSDRDVIIQIFKNESAVKSFIKDLFNKKNEVYFYTSTIIQFLLRNYYKQEQQWFPIDIDELKEIAHTNLEEFISSRKTFDKRAFEYFYYDCWNSLDPQTSKIEITQKANNLIRPYIEKYFEKYLWFTIRPKYSPPVEPVYVFEPFTSQYFGNFDNFVRIFEDFLSQTHLKIYERLLRDHINQAKLNDDRSFYSEKLPFNLEQVPGTNIIQMKKFKDQTYEDFIKEIKDV